MAYVLDYLPLLLYILLYAGLKLGERTVLKRPGNKIRQAWGDWTVWLILVPMWLVLIGPVLEFFILGNRPYTWEMGLGAALFIAGRILLNQRLSGSGRRICESDRIGRYDSGGHRDL